MHACGWALPEQGLWRVIVYQCLVLGVLTLGIKYPLANLCLVISMRKKRIAIVAALTTLALIGAVFAAVASLTGQRASNELDSYTNLNCANKTHQGWRLTQRSLFGRPVHVPCCDGEPEPVRVLCYQNSF